MYMGMGMGMDMGMRMGTTFMAYTSAVFGVEKIGAATGLWRGAAPATDHYDGGGDRPMVGLCSCTRVTAHTTYHRHSRHTPARPHDRHHEHNAHGRMNTRGHLGCGGGDAHAHRCASGRASRVRRQQQQADHLEKLLRHALSSKSYSC